MIKWKSRIDAATRPAPASTGVFAEPEFRALWGAYLQSIIGDQLARVALSVLVYNRTGSAAWTAATYALTYLPALVSGILLSGLADRYPRRSVMAIADLVRAALVGLMAIPVVPLPVLALLLIAVQLAEAPFVAAQRTLLPAIVGDERYERSQRIMLVTYQIGQLFGFALAGVLVQHIGPYRALGINALTFLVSAIMVLAIVRTRPAAAPAVEHERHPGLIHQVRNGARLIWADRSLRALAALGWLAGFSVVPEGLAAPFAEELGVGGFGVGLLLAARPAGVVIGATLLGTSRVGQVRRLRWLAPLAVGAVLPYVFFLVSPPLMAALLLLLASGVCAAYQITAGATFIRLAPDHQRGQAFGLARSGQVAVQGLGVAAGGLVAQWTGSVAITIAVAGIAGSVCAAAAAVAWIRADPRRIAALLYPSQSPPVR